MEIKLLDEILKYLIYVQNVEKPYIANLKDIDLQFQDVNEQLFSSAINKLINDNYIYLGENVKLKDVKPLFIAGICNITIDGILFINAGGYENYYAEAKRKENEYEKIQTEQSRQARVLVSLNKWMNILTFVIAFGTLVAAIYYSIEILKSLRIYE